MKLFLLCISEMLSTGIQFYFQHCWNSLGCVTHALIHLGLLKVWESFVAFSTYFSRTGDAALSPPDIVLIIWSCLSKFWHHLYGFASGWQPIEIACFILARSSHIFVTANIQTEKKFVQNSGWCYELFVWSILPLKPSLYYVCTSYPPLIFTLFPNQQRNDCVISSRFLI